MLSFYLMIYFISPPTVVIRLVKHLKSVGLYLKVSEGSSQLSHVESETPGRASGAVRFVLNILLLRWTPAGDRHRQRRAQEQQTGTTNTHDIRVRREEEGIRKRTQRSFPAARCSRDSSEVRNENTGAAREHGANWVNSAFLADTPTTIAATRT